MARGAAGRRKPVWIKIVGIGILVVGAVAFAATFVSPLFLSQTADVALIAGDPRPFKVKPKDPGGAKIPHQETTVMGMLGSRNAGQEDVEVLTPPAAVPEMPPAPVPTETKPIVAQEPALPKTAPSDLTAVSPTLSPDTNNQGTDGDNPEQITGSANAQSIDQNDSQTVVQSETPQKVDQNTDGGTTDMQMPVEKPVKQAEPAQQISPKHVLDVDGDEPQYIVQLAAFRDPSKAMEQAGLLGRNHRSRLNGTELGTMKIDTGENGVFWRVVTEPLLRAEADTLCSNLKRAGQDCILRKFNILSQ